MRELKKIVRDLDVRNGKNVIDDSTLRSSRLYDFNSANLQHRLKPVEYSPRFLYLTSFKMNTNGTRYAYNGVYISRHRNMLVAESFLGSLRFMVGILCIQMADHGIQKHVLILVLNTYFIHHMKRV